jgi:transposase
VQRDERSKGRRKFIRDRVLRGEEVDEIARRLGLKKGSVQNQINAVLRSLDPAEVENPAVRRRVERLRLRDAMPRHTFLDVDEVEVTDEAQRVAVELRRSGMTWQGVADEMGLYDRSHARQVALGKPSRRWA